MGSEPARLDVLTMGRVGVDIYPLQAGVALEDVTTFGKYLGGSATNVAVAAARPGPQRRGHHPDRAGPVRPVRAPRAASSYGVERPVRHRGTGPAHAGHVLRDLPPGRLPDLLLPLPEGAGPGDPRRRTGLRRDPRRPACSGSPPPACAPSRAARATLAALEARGRSGVTVLDLDYRPMFWASREAGPRGRRPGARPGHRRGRQPGRVRHGRRRERSMASRACAARPGPGPGRGEAGPARCARRDFGTTRWSRRRFRSAILNGLGAGDAFGGALCHGLLAGLGHRAW